MGKMFKEYYKDHSFKRLEELIKSKIDYRIEFNVLLNSIKNLSEISDVKIIRDAMEYAETIRSKYTITECVYGSVTISDNMSRIDFDTQSISGIKQSNILCIYVP